MKTLLKKPSSITTPSCEGVSKLLNSSLDVICSIGNDGTFIFVSNAARHVWGYEPMELIGKQYIDFVVDQDKPMTESIAAQIMLGLNVTNFENRYRRKDGIVVPIMWSAHWDNEEQVMYCVAKDATEKKRAEAALVRSALETRIQARRTEEILESMQDGFLSMDRSWRVIYFNRQAELMTRKSKAEVIGNVFWRVFPLAVDTIAYTECRRALKENVQVNFEIYSGLYNNWFEVTGYPSKSGISICFKNISERKRQEVELKDINRRYELISKATSDVIWDWDLVSGNIHFGETLTTLFGYEERSGLIEEMWLDKVHADDQGKVILSLNTALKDNACDRWQAEYRMLRKDGLSVFVLDRGFITRNDQGIATRMVGSIQDISAIKEKNEELRKLSLVATETSNAVIITDAQEKITWVNKAFTDITEYTAEEAIGRKPSEFLQGKNTSPNFRTYLREQIKNKEPFCCEIVNYSKSGREYWIELKGQPIFNEKGELEQFFAIQTDVTERFEMQRMVVEEHIAAQQEITKAIIDTQEKERSKIGRELHDNVNQILATIKLYLKNIDSVPESQVTFLKNAIELSDLAITESRRLSHQLVTPEIKKLGFRETIEQLLEHYQTLNLFSVDFRFTVCEDKISKDFSLAIYRILQEALNNVVKYANANKVFVGVLFEDMMVKLIVQDDGIGQDCTRHSYGLGLKNMQNRAGLYKGKLTFNSSPGNGCTIIVQFPTVNNEVVAVNWENASPSWESA